VGDKQTLNLIKELVPCPSLRYKRPQGCRNTMSKGTRGHLIYAAAAPAEGTKRWHAEGIVFSTTFPEPVEKIHRMKSKLDFQTEKQARDHAIALCKIWIDRQRGKIILTCQRRALGFNCSTSMGCSNATSRIGQPKGPDGEDRPFFFVQCRKCECLL